jgi:LacI family transcriptional regulator
VAEACRKLIELGHRRIGFVRGPQGFRSAKERELGFHDALRSAGLTMPEELSAQGDYRINSGTEAGRTLLSLKSRPTAIFASNDEMAAGVMQVALGQGIAVPEQLSIIGFDDSPTATHIWPRLSTVRWPIREMGAHAAHLLVSDFLPPVQGMDEPEYAKLPSMFIERQSVAAPEKSGVK